MHGFPRRVFNLSGFPHDSLITVACLYDFFHAPVQPQSNGIESVAVEGFPRSAKVKQNHGKQRLYLNQKVSNYRGFWTTVTHLLKELHASS
jgi:hypothetical protein